MNTGTFVLVGILILIGCIVVIVTVKPLAEKHYGQKPLERAFGVILKRQQTNSEKMMDIADYYVQVDKDKKIWLKCYHESEIVPIRPGDYGWIEYRGIKIESFERTGTAQDDRR